MKTKMFLTGLLAVALVTVFATGQFTAGAATTERTEWGQPASVGQGQIATFVTLDSGGNPASVGVRFTNGMLSGLPDDDTETVLQFPEAAKATPLDHFVLNWNPHGHEPPGIYSAPHFDFHFYTVPENEVAAVQAGSCTSAQDSRIPNPPGSVPLTCDSFATAMQALPADMMPAGYQMMTAVAPNMGNHLVDPASPEFNGKPFTYTWIYGAYGGKLTFLEPMVTKAFLEKSEDIAVPLKLPKAMPQAGWYPTEYRIQHQPDNGTHTVSLNGFKWFAASNGQPGA